MAKEITRKMCINEVIQTYPETIPVFLQHGLSCIGCALSQFETIEQGALAHGMDVDTLIKDINGTIKKK